MIKERIQLSQIDVFLLLLCIKHTRFAYRKDTQDLPKLTEEMG